MIRYLKWLCIISKIMERKIVPIYLNLMITIKKTKLKRRMLKKVKRKKIKRRIKKEKMVM